MSRSDFKEFGERDALFRNSKGKVKPAPELPEGVRVADVHCHLGMLDDPALALARAAVHGFGLLVCVLDPSEHEVAEGETELGARETMERMDAWVDEARDILEQWSDPDAALPRVRFAIGVHPHNAKHFGSAEGELLELLHDERCSCVGEIGLDYHYDLSPRDVQREVFARQLQIADEAQLPVELHLREAHADALDILREHGVPQAGCVVHCFNLDAAVLEPFLELGCHISLGGPLTFKKSHYTRDAVLKVPLDRLLTETDAPYMAPEPLRGTVCTPDQTVYTLRTLLDCFGYAGRERAEALLQPRPSDIEAGMSPVDTSGIDFARLQGGLSEAQFCERVYANAVELLDRPATPWQLR